MIQTHYRYCIQYGSTRTVQLLVHYGSLTQRMAYNPNQCRPSTPENMSGVAADGACSLALMNMDDPFASRISMKLPAVQPLRLMLGSPDSIDRQAAVDTYLRLAHWRMSSRPLGRMLPRLLHPLHGLQPSHPSCTGVSAGKQWQVTQILKTSYYLQHASPDFRAVTMVRSHHTTK